jgi:beta-glucosidase
MNRREMLRNSALGLGGLMILPPILQSFMTPTGITKADFGKDFKWGVATAAYQIEGAWNVDGKGLSIWDTFSHNPKNIKTKETGDVACDFYNRYPDDLKILKSLNMQVFRFSLSWSRIFPEGIGTVNPKGVEFYHKVIDKCLELGLEPWITTYHWDLPQALQDKGGWANREIITWFSEYVDFITKEYGGKVKNWMVLNEPMAFVAVGNLMGMHAPGKRSLSTFAAATHYATMCQAEGGRIIRRNVPNAHVGTTFSCSAVMPKSDAPRHKKAARKMDALLNRLFLEPALGMDYPTDWKVFKKIRKYVQPGDMEKAKFDFDFIGVQNYTRLMARFSIWPPILWANQVKPKKLSDNITQMNWEVYPEGIYKVLKQFAAYKNMPPLYVTENGAAFPDVVEGEHVHDAKRVQYFKDYLEQVLRAKKDGVDVRGYFVWSLMDNFEWAEGYMPRFGLVNIDFETQKRTIKDSGLFFREFLK